MADTQKFRSALNGFNRNDVVTYIEYLNNKHRSEITQLQNQLAAAKRGGDTKALEEENAALKQQIRELQAQLAAKPAAVPAGPSCTEQELEAYRRAERAERMAVERARQISQQAKGILADATAKVQISATQLDEAAKNMTAQMDAYKCAVMVAGNILNEAANTLGTVCPEE